MNRQEYLQKHWSPYPKAPELVLYSGRILQLRTQGPYLVLKTEKNQLVSDFSVRDLRLAEILQPGDLIAVDENEKVYLLAPGKSISAPVDGKTLQLWSLFLSSLRDFFTLREFYEIPTPSLVPCPGTEPSLEVFSTQMKRGSEASKMFLPTSPELHLKKALCLGFDKVYEIKNCFRNDEFSPHHEPEFTMLEWYRSYVDLKSIVTDVMDLISFITSRFSQENLCYPQKFNFVSMADLFKKYTGHEITPQFSLEDYKKLAEELGVQGRGLQSIDDYFFAIFLEKIEPQLPAHEMTIIKNYPPFQAALARLTMDGWADRMEIYFGGFELANAFNELNDPKEQMRRFISDIEKKKSLGKSEINLDPDFIDYLDKGMPPAAGIALGVERLFMALFRIEKIQQIKLFPYQK